MNTSLSKLSFFAVAVLWGSSFAFQKQILEQVSVVTFTFWNFFFSGCIFYVYALYTKTPLFIKVREGIILGVLLTLLELFQMTGLAYSSAANTVFLSNIGMLIIPYLGWLLFKHEVSRADVLAVLVAIIGMYFLVGGISGLGFGEGMLLVSAVCMAFYFLYSEYISSRGKSYVLSHLVWQCFVTASICLLIGVFTHETFRVPSSLVYTLLWQIILFTALPYMLVQWASRYADDMLVTLYDGVIEPLVGALVAWVLFKEATTQVQVFGGLLMVFSFAFAQILGTRYFFRKMIKL